MLSDARVTGQLELGPFKLLNALDLPSAHAAGRVRTTAILRYDAHVGVPLAGPDALEMADEVIALASLVSGARLRAGPFTRMFSPGGDPRGQPSGLRWDPDPVLASPNLPVLPRALRCQLGASPLDTFPQVPPRAAIELVRAARMYRDALWLAESETNLAWLLLVSAVEVAAVFDKHGGGEPSEIFAQLNPTLAGTIRESGGEQLLHVVASSFAHLMGSTNRFIKFAMKHAPKSGPEGTPRVYPFKWSRSNLRKALNTIYTYRSNALHTGQPFPYMMRLAPMKLLPGDVTPEVPQNSPDGTDRELPMLLHTFEHVVRAVLLSWWKSLIEQPAASGAVRAKAPTG